MEIMIIKFFKFLFFLITGEIIQYYGIKELKGLTFIDLLSKYSWILNAKIEDAVISEDENGLVWESGTWRSGVWKGGNWLQNPLYKNKIVFLFIKTPSK